MWLLFLNYENYCFICQWCELILNWRCPTCFNTFVRLLCTVGFSVYVHIKAGHITDAQEARGAAFCYEQCQGYWFNTSFFFKIFITFCVNNKTYTETHAQVITWASRMLVITHDVSMVTRSSAAMGRVGPRELLPWQPTNSIRHLVPAEVEIRGVGLDHRCGAVKRTNFLIVTNICKRHTGFRLKVFMLHHDRQQPFIVSRRGQTAFCPFI